MRVAQFISFILLMSSSVVNATLVTIEHKIYADENLYNTNWGHWWYGPTDGDRLIANNNDGALGDGSPANYVSFNSSPYAFNKNQIIGLSISVTGSVRDLSPTVYTGANGCYSEGVCDSNEDPYFRNLPVYSVIGLWSTTYDHITPVKFDSNGVGYALGDAGYDDEDFFSTTTSPFFIGQGKTFDFSQLAPASVDNLYLFLAENDGAFSDNFIDDYYLASIVVETAEVPISPSSLLMFSALTTLFGFSHRRKK